MKQQRRNILIALFLLCGQLLAAQSIRVKAGINRDKILIGEPITLQLEAVVEGAVPFTWFAVDSINHFEFIDKGKIDTTTSNDATVYSQTLTITSFDSGRWVLPAFVIQSGNREYLTDSLAVSVAYSNFDPNQDYPDIKEIIDAENPNIQYINYVLGGLLLLALIGFVYFIRKKQVPAAAIVTVKTSSKLSPLQEAMEALQQLPTLAGTNSKLYHIQLNDVLRHYVYRRAGIATSEKTSSELIVHLQQYRLPQESIISLAQTLRLNDAVKFAKYQPAAEENNQALLQVKNSIQQLDKLI